MPETTENTRVSRILGRLENVVVIFSGLSIAAIMLVVVSDVAMRYVFQKPLGWSYDLIGSYLMICVFFFALSDTLHSHSHIAIDVFAHKLPRRFEHMSLTIGYAASTVILLMIAWQGWYRCQSAFADNNMISTTVPWPTWPSYFMVAVGSAIMSLRCIVRSFGHAASFVTGRDLADLPPPPVTAVDHEEAGL
ncbi:MAG: TRAP transporter small permease [Sulfitobacter litoralis]|uniref:TRAP transporter small permease n=1 Tax=Sulfitobacter litoralis TaxID=335975 RepID=UPI003001B32F